MSETSKPPRPPNPPSPPAPRPPAPTPTPGPGPAPAPASHRRFTFETAARDASGANAWTFEVVQMRGEEMISRPFRFELLLSSTHPRVDLDAVLKADAHFTIFPPKAADKPAPYHGCLAEFDQLQQVNDQLYLYRAVLVPHLWRLSQYRHSNIFLDTAIDEIVTGLLKSLGSLADQTSQSEGMDLPPGFRNKLLRPGGKTYYGPREYVCQYQETPLDFISRWLEKEGIYYYFEHEKRRSELLVLLDDKIAQDEQSFQAQYQSVGHRGADQSPNSVQGFICRMRPVVEGVELRDFDPRAADKAPQREEYTRTSQSASDRAWPGARTGIDMHFGDNARPEIAPTTAPVGLAHEGRRYAQVRAQERFSQARVFYGEATAVGLRSGKLMALSGHFREPDGNTYLVTEITHEGSQADVVAPGVQLPGTQGTAGQHQTYYRNSFVALPSDTQYRTPWRTARPQIVGTLSATVDGASAESARAAAQAAAAAKSPAPSAEEIKKAGDDAAKNYVPYADLDDQGRYRVRMPFDAGQRGLKHASAPVRMATPYSGDTHGMHFPLLKGAEVLLAFADGDPDQPVIVAAVPNSVNRNVVTDKNMTRNRVLTQGGNEFVLDDKKGAQAVWLYSPTSTSLLGLGKVDGKDTVYTENRNAAEAKAEDKTHDKDVKAGTGVLIASQGKLQQLVKEEEVSNWGTKFSLSAGNSTSISAAFDTKFSWGASLGISASSDVKWAMDVLPNPVSMLNLEAPKWTKKLAMKSISISDSSSFKFMSTDEETKAAESVSFVAGSTIDPKWITVRGYSRAIKASVTAWMAATFLYQKLGKDWAEQNLLGKEGGKAVQPVSTVVFLGMVQAMSRQFADKLRDLPLSSRGEFDKVGVRLAVNALERDDAGDPLDDVAGASQQVLRAEVNLNVAGGAEIKSANESDWLSMLNDPPGGGVAVPASASWAGFTGGQASLAGGSSVDVHAPLIAMKSPMEGAVSLTLSDGSQPASKQSIALATPDVSFMLADKTIKATANKVEIGTGLIVPNPLVSVLEAQVAIAKKAAHGARLNFQLAVRTERFAPAQTKELASAKTALARKALQLARKVLDDAKLRLQSAKAVESATVMVGMTVTTDKVKLAGGGASVDVSAQGVSLAFGASSVHVSAQGIEQSGPLIKLG